LKSAAIKPMQKVVFPAFCPVADMNMRSGLLLIYEIISFPT